MQKQCDDGRESYLITAFRAGGEYTTVHRQKQEGLPGLQYEKRGMMT